MTDTVPASAPPAGRMHKAGYKLGEKLELRLLLMEEQSRSAVMSHQIRLFNAKLERLKLDFDAGRMAVMLRELRLKCILPDDHLYSVAKLRTVVLQKLYPDMFPPESAEGDRRGGVSTKDKALSSMARHYFKWLLRYFTYLQELHEHFTGRIYKCLCKYFYDGSLFRREISRISRHGSASLGSRTSTRSSLGADSGRSTARSEALRSMDEEETAALQRERSLTSLLSLSQRFSAIGSLYDTQQVDFYAGRLKDVMGSLRHLMNEDAPIDSNFFSSDSQEALAGVKVEAGTEDLIRLIPDVLIKLGKAAWLAQQWVLQDELRTKDAGERLRGLLSLETQMEGRLRELGREVVRLEEDLGQRNQELQQLLRKEERSTELMLKLQDLQDYLRRLDQSARALETLKKELRTREKELRAASPHQASSSSELNEIHSRLKTVQLQQFLVNRHLGTLGYQKQLTQADFSVELEVKPTIIHYTNSLQDSIEHIEDELRDRHTEIDNIRAALIPVQEDRKYLSEHIHKRDHQGPPKRAAHTMSTNQTEEDKQGAAAAPKQRLSMVPLTSDSSSDDEDSYFESRVPKPRKVPHTAGSAPTSRRFQDVVLNSSSETLDSSPPLRPTSTKEDTNDNLSAGDRRRARVLAPDPSKLDQNPEVAPDQPKKTPAPPKDSPAPTTDTPALPKAAPAGTVREEKTASRKSPRAESISPTDSEIFHRVMVSKAFPGRRDCSGEGPLPMAAFKVPLSHLQSTERDDHAFLGRRMAPYSRNPGMCICDQEPAPGTPVCMPITQAMRASRIPRYLQPHPPLEPRQAMQPGGPMDYQSPPRPRQFLHDTSVYQGMNSRMASQRKQSPLVEPLTYVAPSGGRVLMWKPPINSTSAWGYRPRQSDMLEHTNHHAPRPKVPSTMVHDYKPMTPPAPSNAKKPDDRASRPIPTKVVSTDINGKVYVEIRPMQFGYNANALNDGRDGNRPRESKAMQILSRPTPQILLSSPSPVPSTSGGQGSSYDLQESLDRGQPISSDISSDEEADDSPAVNKPNESPDEKKEM